MIANALFDLAAHPKYLAPLRAEAEGAVEQYGWTKEAMNKMRGLDSFLKESSRMRGTGSSSSLSLSSFSHAADTSKHP
jgi:hypothetical protein